MVLDKAFLGSQPLAPAIYVTGAFFYIKQTGAVGVSRLTYLRTEKTKDRLFRLFK